MNQSMVEVQRNGFGAWSYPMCTARVENRALIIMPLYETRAADPVRLELHQWISCEVYDERDQLVATFENDGRTVNASVPGADRHAVTAGVR